MRPRPHRRATSLRHNLNNHRGTQLAATTSCPGQDTLTQTHSCEIKATVPKILRPPPPQNPAGTAVSVCLACIGKSTHVLLLPTVAQLPRDPNVQQFNPRAAPDGVAPDSQEFRMKGTALLARSKAFSFAASFSSGPHQRCPRRVVSGHRHSTPTYTLPAGETSPQQQQQQTDTEALR